MTFNDEMWFKKIGVEMFLRAKKFEKMVTGRAFASIILSCMIVAMPRDCVASPWVVNPVLSIQGARILYSGRKDYAQYDLIAGKINYVEDVAGEGFRPLHKKSITGVIDRRLYDFDKQKSAIEIYKNVMASLVRAKYRILYQCSGAACGGTAGWRLFLSNRLGGEDISQHYVAAVKEDSLKRSHYFAFYVNDVADQPRALMDRVMVTSGEVADGSSS